MPEKIKELKPPSGLTRLALRAPLWLYRLGLGWLLGSRFLQLTHTGRKSGLPRQTVLEVVRHDTQSDTFYVVSGWGESSDWYRNVIENHLVTIRTGHRRIEARVERLSAELAGDELVDYHHRHPRALSQLAGFMGYRLDGSEADARALGELLPVIAIQPQHTSST